MIDWANLVTSALTQEVENALASTVLAPTEQAPDRLVCPLPDRGEVVKGFVLSSIDGARGCASCAHLRRPGLAYGYCGDGLEDLPGDYGPGHPLRCLPGDLGAACPRWSGRTE